jgi:pimeloyl-ACP methyl ester carboxylesterase
MSATTEKSGATAIRPFHVDIPDEALEDLRRRIAATRWPDKETVDDGSQGTPLAKIQDLVHHWGTDYDWRRFETKLNALPQFVTNLGGVKIHFIRVRSPQPGALPLIMTHGWPGSIVELLDTVGPLTDPTAHGGHPEDAFDLVLPSMPGYGFSDRPTSAGWGPERIAQAWAELMNRLGYTRYVSQGGDWGSVVAEAMGRQAPAGLLGIHVNLPATVPAEVTAALAAGAPAPDGLSKEECAAYEKLATAAKTGGRAYFAMLTARPQNMGYGMADSPAGLAAWMLAHGGFTQWTYSTDAERSPTKDDVLDDITLYWLTNTGTSAGNIYWENGGGNPNSAAAQRTGEISVPVAITVFPGESYQAPHTWAERAYPNLNYRTKWTRAVTSPPGNSPTSSPQRSARHSDPSAKQKRSPRPRAQRSNADERWQGKATRWSTTRKSPNSRRTPTLGLRRNEPRIRAREGTRLRHRDARAAMNAGGRERRSECSGQELREPAAVLWRPADGRR